MQGSESSNIIFINFCSYCGKTLKDEWKFCPFCKAQVASFLCVFCGKEVKTHWKYCPYCKNEVKTEHNNKQRVDKCNEWLRDILKK